LGAGGRVPAVPRGLPVGALFAYSQRGYVHEDVVLGMHLPTVLAALLVMMAVCAALSWLCTSGATPSRRSRRRSSGRCWASRCSARSCCCRCYSPLESCPARRGASVGGSASDGELPLSVSIAYHRDSCYHAGRQSAYLTLAPNRRELRSGRERSQNRARGNPIIEAYPHEGRQCRNYRIGRCGAWTKRRTRNSTGRHGWSRT
jgi:hypothetical protein